MRMLLLTTILAISVCFVSVLHALDKDNGPARVGASAPGFTLKDQNGKPVSLADFGGKIVVLEWVNPNCPFVQRHYTAGTFSTLADKYASKGVVWLAVNSTHTSTPDDNKAWVEKNSLKYPILGDASGDLGLAYGAKTTPHMFIIDEGGVLAYAGAIDNDREGGKTDGKVNYVDKALGELTSGKAVSEPETQPYGCTVKYAP